MKFSVFGSATGLLLSLLAGCTGSGPGGGLLRTATPHEAYERSLKSADLDKTALGTLWQAAAQQALRDTIPIAVPYRESGYFSASKPTATGYRVRGVRGDKLLIRVEVLGRQAGRVFVDIFALNGQRQELVAYAKANADSSSFAAELVWEPRRTQFGLIRLQPELLRSGRYTISITRDPAFQFPVQGRTSKQISSYFGVPRDGGRRRHEGIDIFAPKGTPAIASVDGVVAQVGVNELGGNVVFLSDNNQAQRLYYAHLDRFNVEAGQRVSAGDTVGFVGNTGNARTTAPHLHFGVYANAEGALNPLPFVRLGTGPARQELPTPGLLGDTVRLKAGRTALRRAPGSQSSLVRELPRLQPLTILGGTATWLRMALPTGEIGYLKRDEVEEIGKPIRTVIINVPGQLLEEAHPEAAMITPLAAGSKAKILAEMPPYILVENEIGQTGWLLQEK